MPPSSNVAAMCGCCCSLKHLQLQGGGWKLLGSISEGVETNISCFKMVRKCGWKYQSSYSSCSSGSPPPKSLPPSPPPVLRHHNNSNNFQRKSSRWTFYDASELPSVHFNPLISFLKLNDDGLILCRSTQSRLRRRPSSVRSSTAFTAKKDATGPENFVN